jgi:hypothetical protein
MSITNELDELIALYGNTRDALNVTLAKLHQAQSEVAVLKEAAQQSVQRTMADDGPECYCSNPSYPLGNCVNCGLPPHR